MTDDEPADDVGADRPEMTVVNQGRYSTMLLAGLVEANMALILWFVSFIAFIEYRSAAVGAVGIVLALFCTIGANKMLTKGICYRINSVMGTEPPFVLDEVDSDELAENGRVVLDD